LITENLDRFVTGRGPLAAHVRRFEELAECPLLAQSGHTELHCTCLLLGVKRTFWEGTLFG
jgi:hypothetical protein